MIVDVIIPAYNEEQSIGLVLNDIPKNLVREVIVVNNNSSDNTAARAQDAGATVVDEPKPGYGAACLKGIKHLKNKPEAPDVVVFLDGDYSDHPEEMSAVIAPIVKKEIDFVIGSRAQGNRESGSMMPQQMFGNWLATFLMKILYGVKYTDLGPFRAIRYNELLALGMADTNFGWTVEMQVKAAKQKLRFCEVPVSYRRRVGISKVSGTIKGTVMAGYKIIFTIFKYR